MNYPTLLAATLTLGISAVTSAAQPRWHSNLKTAAAESLKTGKPMFVVFRCER